MRPCSESGILASSLKYKVVFRKVFCESGSGGLWNRQEVVGDMPGSQPTHIYDGLALKCLFYDSARAIMRAAANPSQVQDLLPRSDVAAACRRMLALWCRYARHRQLGGCWFESQSVHWNLLGCNANHCQEHFRTEQRFLSSLFANQSHRFTEPGCAKASLPCLLAWKC